MKILFSIKKCCGNLLPDGFKKYQLTLYLLTLVLCFLCFQHGDLFHTIISAKAYLNGHFLDFYDYNKPIVSGNDYFPLLYLIFALWLLPLKALGLLGPAKSLTVVVIVWSKLLLVSCFVGLAVITYKISTVLTDGDVKQSQLTAAIFATNPIAVFAVFIFGQYDVIGLLIALTGFYFYLQKKMVTCAGLFSLAISCKFFPLVIFIPLLLLSEKKPSQLLKYIGIAAALPLLQIAIYWHNEAFRSYTLFGGVAAGRLGSLSELWLSAQLHIPYLIIVYFILCLYAYIKEPDSEIEFKKISVFLCAVAYGVFFSTVVWHPQWLIYITPFFALSSIYLMQKEKFYLIELLGVCAYFFLVVVFFPKNVDATLLNSGLLSRLFVSNPIILADALSHAKFICIMRGIFLIYLFLPILMFIFQKRNALVSASINTQMRYFNCRFILGLAFFLVPIFFCALMPLWLP